MTPERLGALLATAAAPRDLDALLRRHGGAPWFNERHIVGALGRAAKLARSTPGVAAASPRPSPRQRQQDAAAAVMGGGTADGAPDLAAEQLRSIARALAAPLQRALPACQPRQVAVAVWAYARLGVAPPESLLDAVAAELLSWGKLAEAAPQALASLAWGMARLGRSDARLFAALGDAAAARAGEMAGRELSQLVWAFAKAGVRHDALFAAVGARVRRALAAAAREERRLLERLEALDGGGGGGGGQEAGAAARDQDETGDDEDEGEEDDDNGRWRAGAGAPRRAPRRLRRAFVDDPLGVHLTTQGLANVAWAHAALGCAGAAPLVRDVARAIGARPLLLEARAEEVAAVLWSLAALGVDPEQQEEQVDGDSSSGGGGGGGPDGGSGSDLACELVAAALRRPGECGAAEVSNMLWSLASLQQLREAAAAAAAPAAGGRHHLHHPSQQQQQQPEADADRALDGGAPTPSTGPLAETAAALCRALHGRLAAANGADVAQALWALATLRVFDAPLLAALASAAGALAATGLLAPAEVANAAWALARLGFRDDGALRALCDAAAELAREKRLEAADVANLAWAFAALDAPHAALTERLAGYARYKAAAMEPRALTVTAWGLAKAGCRDARAFGALADAAAARAEEMGGRDLATAARAVALLPREALADGKAAALLAAAARRASEAAAAAAAAAESSSGGAGGIAPAELRQAVRALAAAAAAHGAEAAVSEHLASARQSLAALLPGSAGAAGDIGGGAEQAPPDGAMEPQLRVALARS